MWLRIDDKLPSHSKFVGIDPRAGWLWVKGLCYCGQHLTDGRIPHHVAQAIAAAVDPQQALLDMEHPLLGALVIRKLWMRTRYGYRVHDYLRYNPSAKVVKARRAVLEAGRSIGGHRRAESASREHGRFTSRSQQGKPAKTSRAPGGPSPAPVPARTRSSTPRDKEPPRIPPRGPIADLVDAFRHLPGLGATDRDGGVIAGLVGQYGAEFVGRVIRQNGQMIGAAQYPLQYLVKACAGESVRAIPLANPSVSTRPEILDRPGLSPEQIATNQRKSGEIVAQLAARKAMVS